MLPAPEATIATFHRPKAAAAERNKRRWLAGRRHLDPLYNVCPAADHSNGPLPGSRREVYETKLEETQSTILSTIGILMSLLLAIFICFLSPNASSVPDKTPTVFVNKAAPQYRFQLLNEEERYVDQNGKKGTFRLESNAYILIDEDNQERRFQIKGESLIGPQGGEWVPRDKLVKNPWKVVTPVNVFVSDRSTGKPLTEFSYTYTIETPEHKFDPLLVQPIDVKSKAGSFQFSAPEACEIYIHIENSTILTGFNESNSGNHKLTSKNKERKIEVLVDIGSLIQGKVTDKQTGKPVEGAIVSPIVFASPLFCPDHSRSVVSNAEGQFQIAGIDNSLGISVWHSDYFESGCSDFEKNSEITGDKTYFTEIDLESGETFTGVIKDLAGLPLTGVTVSDESGKQVQTDDQGTFVLRSPRKSWREGTYEFSFKKEGYLEKQLKAKAPDANDLSITLNPQPTLKGQVLDGSGKRVTDYEIWVGIGKEPRSWACLSQRVSEPQKQFSLPIRADLDFSEEGKVWVGIKAPGFAVWETQLDFWEGNKSITATLETGVDVMGSVKRDSQTGEIKALLLPNRIHKEDCTNETSQRQELGRIETAVAEDGTFQFHHLSPGHYLLAIAGPGISPQSTGIRISDVTLDLGEFSVTGRGSVQGVFKDPSGSGKPMAFADGLIQFSDNIGNSNADQFPHLAEIEFKTDQHGKFQVTNVPVGKVVIGFPYNVSSDIIDHHSRTANVVAGKTTDVSFFDESGKWEVPVQFIVGDDSATQFSSGTGLGAKRITANVNNRAPLFRIHLESKSDLPSAGFAADWQTLDQNKQIVLQDVQPGPYRLQVGDWLMSRGFHGIIYESDIDIKQNSKAIKVLLGAGCITGQVNWSKDRRYMVHVLGVSKPKGLLRHARCDDDGNFCLRYLPKNNYTLYAHDYDAGWCQLPKTNAEDAVIDIGKHTLQKGGTITGSIPTKYIVDQTVTMVAKHENRITITSPEVHEPIGEVFKISSLWPGKWTVILKRNNKDISKRVVQLNDVETVTCDFSSE